MRGFFETAICRIPNFDFNKTLVVGDSLNADILGGSQINIDTCWFNRSFKKNNTCVRPTYEIYHLSDLNKVLNG
jgi:2-haloacid dehalogenase